MYCKNCGNKVAGDAKFCAVCGATVGGEETFIPASEQSTTITIPPIFAKFLPEMKALFSKNPTKMVSIAAKSRGLEWVIWAVLSLFTYAFSAAVLPLNLVREMAGASASTLLDFIEYPFGGIFGISLLIALIAYVVMAAGFWGLSCLIHKKLIHPFKALNVLSCAMIPLIAAQLVNMLLGLMWFPLTICTTIIALVFLVVFLYVGVQRFEKLESSPAWLFCSIFAVVMAIVLWIGSGIYGAAIKNALESSIGSLLSMLM